MRALHRLCARAPQAAAAQRATVKAFSLRAAAPVTASHQHQPFARLYPTTAFNYTRTFINKQERFHHTSYRDSLLEFP